MGFFSEANYRKLVQTAIAGRPNKGRGEIGRIARYLRVHTTLVSQVLHGSKDFTVEQAHAICEYFAFNDFETEYFLLLVQEERAGNGRYQNYIKKRRETLQRQSQDVNRVHKDRVLDDKDRAILYSSWHYSAVRMATSLDHIQDVKSIAHYLHLPEGRVAEILKFLVESGLCVSDSGKFKMGPQQTHLDRGSPFLARHHANWRLRAAHRADHLQQQDLMYTSPMSISHEHFSLIREEILNLIKKVNSTIRMSEAERLAVFNIDLIDVVEPNEAETISP